jgi:hypothetical protein
MFDCRHENTQSKPQQILFLWTGCLADDFTVTDPEFIARHPGEEMITG